MEAATLAASIVPVKRQQSTGNLGAKSDTKAVKGAFANLLLALQGYAPTEAQSSPGTTTTDPTDKKGKDAASNSLLQALIQLLPGQLQSSLNTTQAAEDSVDSGGSGTVSAKSVAGLSSIINQAIDTLKTSGNAGQVDKSLLADLAGLSQTLQGNQTGAGKTGAVTTAGNTVDDQATASSSLFKNADGQATDLLAAVKTALNQTDPGVLNDKGNAQGGNMAVAESAAIQPRAPDGTTTTVSLNSQTPDETGANGVSNAGSDLKSSGAPTVTQGTMDSTALARTGQATGANGVSNAGSDLKSSGASTVTQGTMDSTALAETGQATGANGVSNAGSDLKSSGASTVTQGTMDSTALAETGQATGALSQSNQDSGMTGHSKETQVKDTSFVKPVSALETQQPQESAPQSPSGSEGMNNLLAQSSLQQHDLSSLTGLGQTTDSKSPTLGASVINQIVASANLAVNNDNASMSIQLKPEWLGDLKLVVDVEQGVVNAHFITQNQVTASLIQARLPELKQALNDQGISWQHLSVSSGAGQGSNQGASSQSQQNLNQSQTQYDYGSGDSTDSDAPPTIPVDYQWAGTGAFNYVV